MSIRVKAAVFLGLTFAIGWGAAFVALKNGGTTHFSTVFVVFAPTIAAIFCTLAFERGQRLKALGLRFRPNWWWLFALLLPFALGSIAVATNLVVVGDNLLALENWKQGYASLVDAPMGQHVSGFGIALTVGIVIHLISEELGWRGYMYHIWRQEGFWRYTIATGLIWGVWHWPGIVLFGLGTDQGLIFNLILYPLATTLQAFCLTIIRDRSRSVIAAGIFHGSWNSVSHMGAGMYGVFAVIASAMLIFALLGRQASANSPAESPNDALRGQDAA